MNSARKRSRNGSPRSRLRHPRSPHRGDPGPTSAAERSSIARARSSTSRATSAAANSSLANSAYGDPRHSASASSNTPSVTSGRSDDPSPTRTSSSKRNASSVARRHPQPISRRTSFDPVVTERRAKPRHQSLERVHRAGPRVVTPEDVEEPITRDHLVGVDEQHREQPALLPASEPNPLTVARRPPAFPAHTAAPPSRRPTPSSPHPTFRKQLRGSWDRAGTGLGGLSLTLWSRKTSSHTTPKGRHHEYPHHPAAPDPRRSRDRSRRTPVRGLRKCLWLRGCRQPGPHSPATTPRSRAPPTPTPSITTSAR